MHSTSNLNHRLLLQVIHCIFSILESILRSGLKICQSVGGLCLCACVAVCVKHRQVDVVGGFFLVCSHWDTWTLLRQQLRRYDLKCVSKEVWILHVRNSDINYVMSKFDKLYQT